MVSVSLVPTCSFFLMALEDLEFLFEVADVKQLHEMIPGCCQKPVPVGVPFYVHYSEFVSMSKMKQSTLDGPLSFLLLWTFLAYNLGLHSCVLYFSCIGLYNYGHMFAFNGSSQITCKILCTVSSILLKKTSAIRY